MKLRKFQKDIVPTLENVDECSFFLPDDSSLKTAGPSVVIPQAAQLAPFFTIEVVFEDGESSVFVIENPPQAHHVQPVEVQQTQTIQPPRPPVSVELEQSRLFYEQLTKVNTDAFNRIQEANAKTFETVVSIFQKNEDRLDKRLKMLLPEVNDDDDPIIPQVVQPSVTPQETVSPITTGLRSLADILSQKLETTVAEMTKPKEE